MEQKQCAKCRERKDISRFGRANGRRDGLCPYCRDCRKTERWHAKNPARHRENVYRWRAAHPERALENQRRWKAANRPRLRELERRRYAKDPFRVMANSKKKYAATHGLAYDIDHEFLRSIWDGRCAVTGIELAPFSEARWRVPLTPSIDRIDPAQGYIRGNVRFVALAINAFMSTWGEASSFAIARQWVYRKEVV